MIRINFLGEKNLDLFLFCREVHAAVHDAGKNQHSSYIQRCDNEDLTSYTSIFSASPIAQL